MLTVTVTDAERAIWTGSYKAFQIANMDALSVAEWLRLWNDGTLEIGGGAAPAFTITLQGARLAFDDRPLILQSTQV